MKSVPASGLWNYTEDRYGAKHYSDRVIERPRPKQALEVGLERSDVVIPAFDFSLATYFNPDVSRIVPHWHKAIVAMLTSILDQFEFHSEDKICYSESRGCEFKSPPSSSQMKVCVETLEAPRTGVISKCRGDFGEVAMEANTIFGRFDSLVPVVRRISSHLSFRSRPSLHRRITGRGQFKKTHSQFYVIRVHLQPAVVTNMRLHTEEFAPPSSRRGRKQRAQRRKKVTSVEFIYLASRDIEKPDICWAELRYCDDAVAGTPTIGTEKDVLQIGDGNGCHAYGLRGAITGWVSMVLPKHSSEL